MASSDPQLIKVQVAVDETSIKEVEVVRCTDNDHFANPVIRRVVPAIVDQQSLLVDVASAPRA